jgi:hypothetical protein
VLGSMPRISTTSESAPGGLATANRVVGQMMRRSPPSPWVTVGRLTWKS